MTEHRNQLSAESCDLKPCPFCGGKGAITLGVTLRETQTVDVICQDCGGTMPAFSEEEAANDWNARTDPVEKCPRPVIPDHSAKACIESGNCGCGARIPDAAQPAAVTKEEIASLLAEFFCGKQWLRNQAADAILARLASQPSPAATVETKPDWCQGADAICHHPACVCVLPHEQCSAASEGARLSNWLADYSHDLKEEGDFDQEAAQLDKASQWIAGHLNVLPQSSGVWQPIETALKDGTPIEACNTRHPSHAPVIVRWDDDGLSGDLPEPHWCDAATRAGDALYYNQNYFDFWKPTTALPRPELGGDK